MSLQKQLEEKFTDLEFAFHESDLYVLPKPGQMKAVVDFIREKKQWSPVVSFSNVDGQDWHLKYFIEVPFGNSKFWEAKEKENDLLPCPWCGEPPSSGGDYGNWWRGCINDDCPVRPITGHHETVRAAKTAWEKRTG